MDIYYKKRRWKSYLFLVAILIGIGSMLYTNRLIKQMAEEEKSKVEIWSEANRLLSTLPENDLSNDVFNFLHNIIVKNNTVPIIVVYEGDEIYAHRNLSGKGQKYLERELAKMKTKNEPIVYDNIETENQYIYYDESSLLVKLKYYPVFQLAVILIFIFIAYIAFSSARKAEQNMVWIGMAKETAHQLGTPISSLMAWVELLKDMDVDDEIIKELLKDTDRLGKITERFSKIGSTPELFPENLYANLFEAVNYLKNRVSKKIAFEVNFSEKDELYIPLSSSLFSWVIENLIRNSVDAIENGKGLITVNVFDADDNVIIDFSDNGKGIKKTKQKTIFQPGFTTKKRGWGLGLTLSKRIIENYHQGKIYLRSSTLGKGTMFRIILKKK